MQRTSGVFRLLPVLVAGAVASGGLAGCGVLRTEFAEKSGQPVDYGDLSSAVMAAAPRVAEVRDPSRRVNGFFYAVNVDLEMKSAEPVTSDELDAVVRAIWQTLPWEANTIGLIAGAGDEVVDLRQGAAALESLQVGNLGRSGVKLTGMQARYGEWVAPR